MNSDADNAHSIPDPFRSLGDSASFGDSLVVVGPPPARMPSEWFAGPSVPPTILSQGFDPIWLLHSLRRHWLLAVGLGLMVGATLAVIVGLLTPSRATAEAYLHVASGDPWLVFDINQGDEADFDTYKRTLTTLFKNPVVLQAALRQPGIAQLPSLRDEPDRVSWLADNLDVVFPGNAEILRISLKGEDETEVKRIVEAAKKAFMEEIVLKRRMQRLATMNALDLSHDSTVDEIRRKRQNYQSLAKKFGTMESQSAQVDRKFYLDRFALLLDERNKIDHRMFEEKMKVKQLRAQRSDPQLFEARVSELVEQDSQVVLTQQLLNDLDMRYAEARSYTKRDNLPSLVRMQRERASLVEQLERLRAELRPQIALQLENTPDTEYRETLTSANINQSLLLERGEQVDKQTGELLEEIKKMSEESLELEQLHFDLDQLNRIAGTMANKLEAWRIELQSPARITEIKDEKTGEGTTIIPGIDSLQRYVLVALSGLMGFGLTCFGIAFWDFQFRPLNSPKQVDEGLGLRVIGELPPLGGRGGRKDSASTLAMLTEGIDSVRTRLIHGSQSNGTHVVLVTSAGGLEGRTTVASQLAASLARAGRRTLLVDADVRHPSLHRLFDLPLENGLCELLRAEAELTDVVRPTPAEGLWLLTAGYCDAASLQALAQDQIEPILDRLRADFEFVIIDAAPVLHLADALIVGQHADGAVLSVRRDVTKVPQIHEASELLKSVGVRVLGTVVNGVPRPMRDRASRMRLATTTGNSA